MKIDLTGKRAFVTGSSGGIGRAIAIALADAGADVAVHFYSDSEGADETVRLMGDGTRSLVLDGDVGDSETVTGWFERLDREWGGIDILINNAGIDGVKQNLIDSEIEKWERVVKTNLFGGFYAIRQAVRRMVPAGGGVILSVTSVHDRIPWAGQSAYCASKAGISILSESLALELADSKVRVLCLAPGAIKTDINRDVWEDEAKHADLLEKIPMKRMGKAEEIADLAVVLVSEKTGGYITGTTIYADGGMTNYPSFAKGG